MSLFSNNRTRRSRSRHTRRPTRHWANFGKGGQVLFKIEMRMSCKYINIWQVWQYFKFWRRRYGSEPAYAPAYGAPAYVAPAQSDDSESARRLRTSRRNITGPLVELHQTLAKPQEN